MYACPNLFDSEIQVNRKVRRALSRYLGGLIKYSGKKNCTVIAQASDLSHDSVYEFFDHATDNKSILQAFLNNTISSLPLNTGVWYINIDETLIEKMFAKNIEGASKNWSGVYNKALNGLSIVAAVITNGKITIPITFKTWYSEKDYPDKHETRIELAKQLIIEITKTHTNIIFLMDGGFSSEGMLRFCATHKVRYCMRFHSNKKVVINGLEAQLRNHECIKVSSKRIGRVVNGFYKGIPVRLLAFKRTRKNDVVKIVYLVTSEELSPKKLIRLYKQRWGIEKFYRTSKQHIGLEDCQARSALKQEAHIFAVFVIYAFLQIQKINYKAKNPERILHKIRGPKPGRLLDQFETFCEVL